MVNMKDGASVRCGDNLKGANDRRFLLRQMFALTENH